MTASRFLPEPGTGGYGHIAVEVNGHIGVVVLDRPAKLNAFTVQMHRELVAAFDRLDADDEVRVVLLTGRGRAFCAGADLSLGGSTFDAQATGRQIVGGEYRDEGGIVALRVNRLMKPVLTAFNGPAVGVGVTITLPADIRIAGASARFALPFTRRGISPDGCSSWFLPRLVGPATAADWMLTGRTFDAQEAAARGLVREVVDDDVLLDTAHALARDIAERCAPVSLAVTRSLLNAAQHDPDPVAAHRRESDALWWTGRQHDVREGIAAFFEKRRPSFSGRVRRDLPPKGEEPAMP